MPSPFEQKSVTIDTITWTALTVPFPCNNVTIVNTDLVNTVKIRTTDTDANSQLTLDAGATYPLDQPRSFKDPLHPSGYRFSGTVAYAQATAGTGPLVLICLV